MSVGVFIGIRPSYTDEAQQLAEGYLTAINKVLWENGLGEYQEPKGLPNVYQDYHFGRSVLDHHGASAFGGLAERLGQGRPHLGLLAKNVFRVAFVPVDFPQELQTTF